MAVVLPRSIQPVILCGGSGTRLYPLSTAKIPKQFISLGKLGTLLEATIDRIKKVSSVMTDYIVYDPLLIMNKEHIPPGDYSSYADNIIYEEFSNDTAVAVAIAAMNANRRTKENSIILVLPADHYINNVEPFIRDIAGGICEVTHDNIVLYGIDPSAPETKYGYIIPTQPISFKEKPDAETAFNLINQGALWNSGIFAARIDTVMTALQSSKHGILEWVAHPRAGKAPSFDVAVLQEHQHIYAQHCKDWIWSDVGTWAAFMEIPEIKEEIEQNEKTIIVASNNTSVLNRGHGTVIAIGCSDLNIAVNGSNVLIMSNTGDYNNILKDIASKLNT